MSGRARSKQRLGHASEIPLQAIAEGCCGKWGSESRGVCKACASAVGLGAFGLVRRSRLILRGDRGAIVTGSWFAVQPCARLALSCFLGSPRPPFRYASGGHNHHKENKCIFRILLGASLSALLAMNRNRKTPPRMPVKRGQRHRSQGNARRRKLVAREEAARKPQARRGQGRQGRTDQKEAKC